MVAVRSVDWHTPDGDSTYNSDSGIGGSEAFETQSFRSGSPAGSGSSASGMNTFYPAVNGAASFTAGSSKLDVGFAGMRTTYPTFVNPFMPTGYTQTFGTTDQLRVPTFEGASIPFAGNMSFGTVDMFNNDMTGIGAGLSQGNSDVPMLDSDMDQTLIRAFGSYSNLDQILATAGDHVNGSTIVKSAGDSTRGFDTGAGNDEVNASSKTTTRFHSAGKTVVVTSGTVSADDSSHHASQLELDARDLKKLQDEAKKSKRKVPKTLDSKTTRSAPRKAGGKDAAAKDSKKIKDAKSHNETARKMHDVLDELIHLGVDSAKKIDDVLKLDIAGKIKAAGATLREWKKLADPAAKLGEQITITTVNGRAVISGVYWFAPKGDETIPHTMIQKQTALRAIFAAINNYTDVVESTTSKSFKNRWGSEADHYTQEEKESAVWKLYEALVDVHTNGWTENIYDKAQRDIVNRSMYFSFQDRLDSLCELLKYSKTTCQDIMKGERFFTVIGNPVALIARTKCNKNSNARKNTTLKERTAAKKAAAAAAKAAAKKAATEKKLAAKNQEIDIENEVDAEEVASACTPTSKRVRKEVAPKSRRAQKAAARA